MAQVSRLDVRDATETARHREKSRTPVSFTGRIRRFLTSYAGQLTLALLLAVAARLWILVSSHGMMDGDEAILGLQAEDILHHGVHPIYFADQAYMGSWDAYLVAPLIAVFGPSAYVLHAVTLAESLLLVPLSGILSARLFGQRARLPAMLLAALPPIYVVVGELRMLGGYVETLVLGTALLLLAVQIADRWRQDETRMPSGRSSQWRWVVFGLLTGLGLWIDPLIIYYLVAIALWLLPLALLRLRELVREGDQWLRATMTTMGLTLFAAAVSAAPALWYGVQTDFANLAWLVQTPNVPLDSDPLRVREARYLLTYALPHVAGIQTLWEHFRWSHRVDTVLGLYAGLILVLGAGFALYMLAARWTTRSGKLAGFARLISTRRWNYALAPMLFVVVCLIFWRNSESARYSGAADYAGRFVLPLTTAITLLVAALCVHLPALCRRVVAHVDRRQTGRSAVLTAYRFLAIGALSLLLFAYAVPYALTDEIGAMQSPYAAYLTFPAEHGELMTYLEQHHIRYAWAPYWIAYVSTYLSDEHILVADPRPIHNRLPSDYASVAAADRPSFIVYSDPALGEPQAARMLDALGVTYTAAHFGPYWVLTPLSRTVPPAQMVAYFETNFQVPQP